MITSSGKASAETRAWATSSVPVGWLCVNARLFRSTGAMVGESGFYYNGSVLSANNTLVNGIDYVSITGIFYSYGVVRGWTGSNYNSYYTFKSPNQNS